MSTFLETTKILKHALEAIHRALTVLEWVGECDPITDDDEDNGRCFFCTADKDKPHRPSCIYLLSRIGKQAEEK